MNFVFSMPLIHICAIDLYHTGLSMAIGVKRRHFGMFNCHVSYRTGVSLCIANGRWTLMIGDYDKTKHHQTVPSVQHVRHVRMSYFLSHLLSPFYGSRVVWDCKWANVRKWHVEHWLVGCDMRNTFRWNEHNNLPSKQTSCACENIQFIVI